MRQSAAVLCHDKTSFKTLEATLERKRQAKPMVDGFDADYWDC